MSNTEDWNTSLIQFCSELETLEVIHANYLYLYQETKNERQMILGILDEIKSNDVQRNII